MHRNRSWLGSPVVLAMCLATWTSPVTAQTPPAPELRSGALTGIHDEQLERQRREAEARARQAQAPDVRLPVPAEAAAQALPFTTQLPTETPCFPLQDITLQIISPADDVSVPPDNNTSATAAPTSANARFSAYDFRFVRRALEPYIGQCAGTAGLAQITQHATQVLLSHGLITTQALLSDQDFSSGTLRLDILPGTVDRIAFADASLWGTWRNAVPLRHGDLLTLSALEQGLEQLKRVPSQDADIRIKPGAHPGQSDLVLDVVRQRPWRLVASMDNGGLRETGRLQGQLALGVDNPLGLSDLLDVSVQHDLSPGDKRFGARGASASWSVPLGYTTVSLFGSTRSYFQRIAGANETFLSSGRSQFVELRAEHVIQRNHDGRTALEARLGRRFGKSFLEDFEIVQQYRNNTYYQLGVTLRRYFGTAQLDANLGYRQGVPWFGAQEDLRDRVTRQAVPQTYQYRMFVLDAQLSAPFQIGTLPLRYQAVFRGQTTTDALWAADQITIGGRFSVRGFDGEYTLSAERGFFLRNELQLPLGRTPHALYLGVDYGRVHGYSARWLPGHQLAGGVIGLRGQTGQRFGMLIYDVFVGTPLYRPQKFPTGNVTAGFSLAYRY